MLILYSTLGCHLCEQALEVVSAAGFPRTALTIIDIADNDALIERYGLRIPVVKKGEDGAELGWPFDLQQFCEWYQAG